MIDMARDRTISASAVSVGRHTASDLRLQARGKFLWVGNDKLYVRGVTYGAFRPDQDGHEYSDLEVLERDFAHMAAVGLNAVRIPHTMPPRSVLDVAQRHGLRVMVGLSAEQHYAHGRDRAYHQPRSPWTSQGKE
jgi:beta-galactosidase/beta-glucuronidase